MNGKEITARLLLRIPEEFPQARAWRRHVGSKDIDGRWQKFGRKGESDIDGIVKPHGTRLAIEVKAGKDRLTPEQQRYLDFVTEFGGIAFVAYDVESAIEELRTHLAARR
jgi:hypothetical protein